MGINAVSRAELRGPNASNESSKVIRRRVKHAHSIQLTRQGKTNSQLSVPELRKVCVITMRQQEILDQVTTKFDLSIRGYHRILKLARTIADLNQSDSITTDNLLLAVKLRCPNKGETLNHVG